MVAFLERLLPLAATCAGPTTEEHGPRGPGAPYVHSAYVVHEGEACFEVPPIEPSKDLDNVRHFSMLGVPPAFTPRPGRRFIANGVLEPAEHEFTPADAHVEGAEQSIIVQLHSDTFVLCEQFVVLP